MIGVIYARYSSEKQREESIDGQVRICLEYAKRKGIDVIQTYSDRAISGLTDERPAFQNMLRDCERGGIDCVLVYALNRFSRNSEHYYRYRNQLLGCQVRLLSATETIPDGPFGIIYEAMTVGYGEFYSKELSEKIRRGQTENALKSIYNGGSMPLGYIADAEQHYVIEPVEAAIVREIFKMYSEGKSLTEIIDALNSRDLRTKRGNPFNKNSLHAMLRNRRYLGEYSYRETVRANAFPAIIDQETFDAVQARLTLNKKMSARAKADEPFILTGKVFCGRCGTAMIGESGRSHTGTRHYYYKCGKNKRREGCKKKAVRKAWLEDYIIGYIMRFIFDDSEIGRVADMAMEVQQRDNTVVPMLKRELKQVEKGIGNLLDAIVMTGISESINSRLRDLEQRKAEIEVSIKAEELRSKKLSREEVIYWLKRFRSADVNDIHQRETLVNLFLNAVYVFDDRLVIVFNFKENALTVTLAEATAAAKSATAPASVNVALGSDIACFCPPLKSRIIKSIMRLFHAFFAILAL